MAAERWQRGLLVAAVLFAAWAVDPGALAAFDAPKRFGVLVCLALAASIAVWRTSLLDRRGGPPRRARSDGRASAGLRGESPRRARSDDRASAGLRGESPRRARSDDRADAGLRGESPRRAQSDDRAGACLRAWPGDARVVLLAAIGAALAVALSAWASPHPAIAQDTARGWLLWSLALPLGASLATPLDRGALGAACALAIAANAALSLLQALGFTPGFETTHFAGRFPTGALLGNEGYVALACALALPPCVHALLAPRPADHVDEAVASSPRRVRIVAAVLTVMCIAAIVANRQTTAALAAAFGIVVVLAVHRRALRMLRAGLVVAAILVASAWLPPVRALAWAPWLGDRIPTLQQATTYRIGAWAAAESMWRGRPALGHGPGTYATLSLPHRLDAEIRLRERLVTPPTGTHFEHAHDDYLQFAAEAGVPALLAVLVAFGVLIAGLLRRSARQPEAARLAGLLLAGAVAALAWFPLHVPLTALLLLLAAGRAWRVLSDGEATP